MRSATDVPTNRRVYGAGIKLDSALIAGATGHIGSALVRRLAAEGVRVTALVRKDSPARSRFAHDPHISTVEIEASTPQIMRDSVGSTDADVIFNLASAGVNPAERNPQAMLEGNAGFLVSLLSAIESRKPRLFIHTGSCSEYAFAENGHRIAEDHPARPSSPYGAAKLRASIDGEKLAAERGIPFMNLRLFGVFGVGEAPHRVVPSLIAKLREDQPVNLTAGGQIRDWLYIDDIVDALLAAATCEQPSPSGIFNVCSGHGTRVRELAEQVADALRKPRELLLFGALPYRSDEPMWLVGDHRRFAETAGWRQRVSIQEGIRRMVEQSI